MPDTREPPERFELLRASPHEWGQGRVHRIDREADLTLCGQSPARCPGTTFFGTTTDITCQRCLRSIESRARSEAIRAKWREEQTARDEEREERNRTWQILYGNYLTTPTWKNKRALVHKRANGLCEGCGQSRSTQVHHREYPKGCWPGSPQWISQEKLFHLIALCAECHEDIHP
jgi:hypothetical protein